MSSEYKTIRVPPETYERLLALQRRASVRSSATVPSPLPSRRPHVTLGEIVTNALVLYEQQLDERDDDDER